MTTRGITTLVVCGIAVLPQGAMAQVGQARLPGQVGNSGLARFGSVGSDRLRAGAGSQFGGGGGSQAPGGPLSVRSSGLGMGLNRSAGSRMSSTLSGNHNPLTMSGVSLSGPRAELIMSRDIRGRSPYESGRVNVDTTSPVSRLLTSGSTRRGVMADRYGMIFSREPLSLSPKALPRPPPQEMTDTDRDIISATAEPQMRNSLSVRQRTLQEAEYYFSRGMRAIFGGTPGEAPRYDAVREGQFEFDRVRRLLQDDPRAYLWSALAAIRMGNNHEGMELWKQCLTRYARGGGRLIGLRVDIDGLFTDPAEAARIKQNATGFLTGITNDFNLQLDETTPALRPRGKALTAVTMWLANEKNAYGAAERVQQAQVLESQTLSAEERLPVLGRLYDQFTALREEQQKSKP